MIDLNSIRNKDVREIGAEWLSYQAMRQLQIAPFLQSLGWSEDQARLAQTHIISRAVFPASELETTRWIKKNPAVCEVTGYNIEQVTKDRLYSIPKKLYAEKEALEQHLSSAEITLKTQSPGPILKPKLLPGIGKRSKCFATCFCRSRIPLLFQKKLLPGLKHWGSVTDMIQSTSKKRGPDRAS